MDDTNQINSAKVWVSKNDVDCNLTMTMIKKKMLPLKQHDTVKQQSIPSECFHNAVNYSTW
jgi:hypothetical protein